MTGEAQGDLAEHIVHSYLPHRAQHYPDSHERVEQLCRDHLIPHFGNYTLSDIPQLEIDTYVTKRKAQGAAVATIKKELDTLRAALRAAQVATTFKLPTVREGKEPVWYTKSELESLYSWSPYHGPIWMFLANTGLRRAEAQKARREDIHEGRIKVQSDEEGRTKSGRWRSVPLNATARLALEYLGDDYLLPRMTPQALSRAFGKCAERAGLRGSIHSLRHTFCSQLVMAGVPLRTVQKLAGHASSKTTERYSHLAPQYLEAAVQLLEN